ncbi:hypothetical protein B0H67DRAFT_389406 [Lasiosphaeris hirsuta]|uniref:Uncharacterized protein n=1 Tax=Lasiosphaeris hirsuta TaxID=260670 RepID=A0AA40DMW6_9PEZI|nr:hypothetical protein B0H67DRAFT_389406 [Lasiosphaeris hirsuta]
MMAESYLQRAAWLINDPYSAKDQHMVGECQPRYPNDSGYASQPKTRNTIPNRDITPNDKVASSESPGASRAVSKLIDLLTSKLGTKVKLVPILNGNVDEPSRKTFDTVKPRFEKLLVKHILHLQRPGAIYRPMSTRLIMMGTSSEDATAHIVVLCQPEQKDAVQRFVRSPMIQDLFGKGDATVTPSKVAVLGQAPRQTMWKRNMMESMTRVTWKSNLTYVLIRSYENPNLRRPSCPGLSRHPPLLGPSSTLKARLNRAITTGH